MKSADNVPSATLSFEDLYISNALQIDLFLDNLNEPEASNIFLDSDELSERLIHTFLEWDLYDEYVYRNEWSLDCILFLSTDDPPKTITKDLKIRVDTIREAKALAKEKISQLLDYEIFLDVFSSNSFLSEDDSGHIYKIADYEGNHCGTLIIEHLSNRTERL